MGPSREWTPGVGLTFGAAEGIMVGDVEDTFSFFLFWLALQDIRRIRYFFCLFLLLWIYAIMVYAHSLLFFLSLFSLYHWFFWTFFYSAECALCVHRYAEL